MHTTRTTCRICGHDQLTHLYDFGSQYISNFVEPGHAYDGEPCPIELVYCPECTLVQNPHSAPQDLLYKGTYWYRSGVTDTMRAALADVVRYATSLVELNDGDVVLDIGSNDGTLLGCYPDRLFRVGVEPAKNLASQAQEGVDLLLNDFWDEDIYQNNVVKPAKIITACGMLYDLEDPNAFIAAVAEALHPNGVFIAQLMCLKNMINCNDIGNLAHEHLEFYTLRSLSILLAKHGMHIVDVETNDVNGESYRITICRTVHRNRIWSPQVAQRLANAFASEQSILEDFRCFVTRMEENRDAVQELVCDLVADGHSVYVYGASTKGNFLLQWYGFDSDTIPYAVDRSSEKEGLVTAGSNIYILSEREATYDTPEYFLVLPYAFLPEFIEREKRREWREIGGKFIVPLPEVRIA